MTEQEVNEVKAFNIESGLKGDLLILMKKFSVRREHLLEQRKREGHANPEFNSEAFINRSVKKLKTMGGMGPGGGARIPPRMNLHAGAHVRAPNLNKALGFGSGMGPQIPGLNNPRKMMFPVRADGIDPLGLLGLGAPKMIPPVQQRQRPQRQGIAPRGIPPKGQIIRPPRMTGGAPPRSQQRQQVANRQPIQQRKSKSPINNRSIELRRIRLEQSRKLEASNTILASPTYKIKKRVVPGSANRGGGPSHSIGQTNGHRRGSNHQNQNGLGSQGQPRLPNRPFGTGPVGGVMRPGGDLGPNNSIKTSKIDGKAEEYLRNFHKNNPSTSLGNNNSNKRDIEAGITRSSGIQRSYPNSGAGGGGPGEQLRDSVRRSGDQSKSRRPKIKKSTLTKDSRESLLKFIISQFKKDPDSGSYQDKSLFAPVTEFYIQNQAEGSVDYTGVPSERMNQRNPEVMAFIFDRDKIFCPNCGMRFNRDEYPAHLDEHYLENFNRKKKKIWKKPGKFLSAEEWVTGEEEDRDLFNKSKLLLIVVIFVTNQPTTRNLILCLGLCEVFGLDF